MVVRTDAQETSGRRRCGGWRAVLAWFLALVVLLPFAQAVYTAQKSRERADTAYGYLSQRLPGPELRQKFEIDPRPLRLAARNSVVVSVAATAVGVVVSALAGYAFAKKQFAAKAALFDLVLASMALPPAILMMPLFRLSVSLGLYDTLLGVMLPACVTGFGIFYMRHVISAVPDSLVEAARLDGLSELGALFRVVIPSVWPSVGTLAVLQFIGNWNSFVIPHAVVTSARNYTVAILLGRIMSDYRGLMWNDIMVVVVAAIVPVAVMFVVFNRWVLRGLVAIGEER